MYLPTLITFYWEAGWWHVYSYPAWITDAVAIDPTPGKLV
jgi:hypothetical protein